MSYEENLFYVSSGGASVLYSEDGKSWLSFDVGHNVNALISSDFHLLGLGNENILLNDGVINNVIAIGNNVNVEYEMLWLLGTMQSLKKKIILYWVTATILYVFLAM